MGSTPVGEYLFEHRSANVSVYGKTFLEWFINDYILDSEGRGGGAVISGYYFDDAWSNNGPSEMNAYAVEDLGLTRAELEEITLAYNSNMAAMYIAITAAGKFSFQQFYTTPNIEYPMCGAPLVQQKTCATDLRALCTATSPPQQRATFAAYAPGGCSFSYNPPEFESDLANFLLWRGPRSWLGSSWIGCASVDYASFLQNHAQLSADYGDPLGICAETAPGSGVFSREFSKATVSMNCTSWLPTIAFKNSAAE